MTLDDILHAVASCPPLAWLGALVLLALIFTPAALALAGLTGEQIITLLTSTMRFIVEVIKEFRDTPPKNPQ